MSKTFKTNMQLSDYTPGKPPVTSLLHVRLHCKTLLLTGYKYTLTKCINGGGGAPEALATSFECSIVLRFTQVKWTVISPSLDPPREDERSHLRRSASTRFSAGSEQ